MPAVHDVNGFRTEVVGIGETLVHTHCLGAMTKPFCPLVSELGGCIRNIVNFDYGVHLGTMVQKVMVTTCRSSARRVQEGPGCH